MNFSTRSFKFAGFALLCIAAGSCNEQKIVTQPNSELNSVSTDASTSTNTSTNTNTNIQTLFNRTVGAPIDGQTGLRWIGNFSGTQKSTATSNYFVQASALKEIFSNGTCVGIALYYAKDNLGQLQILPIGIDASGRVLVPRSVLVQSTTISWQTALQWIGGYTGKVKAHFFGINTFNRLLVDQSASSIRITPALDDLGNPQLLMSNGSLTSPSSYEDASIVCPPVCPVLNN